MKERKFKITMEVTVSGRLIEGNEDCSFFVENMIEEYLKGASTEDFSVEAKDVWAKEIHE